MEQGAIENEIRDKAKEWAEEYGEDFLVELVGDYLFEASARVERLCKALAGGDADTLTYEAHTLKSSSANLGAQTFSDLAKRFEEAGRQGDLTVLMDDAELFERQFAAVKASLEKLLCAPSQFIAHER
jgi:HPt (histidine-containing phosphotransfer) domain-containing protein